MDRDQTVWVVVRSLGVIALFSFTISLPMLALSIVTYFTAPSFSGQDPTKHIELMMSMNNTLVTCISETCVYGLFSYYLLRRGRYLFNLIVSNLPAA
jgi:hypothetical protein